MKAKHQRLILAVVALGGIAGAGVLAASALRDEAAYFRTPAEVKAGKAEVGEAMRLGKGAPDATITSTVNSVAFEGNASHIFLKGAAKKDITLTVGRLERVVIPEQGVEAQVTYDADLGLVLPEGTMARE